MKKPLFLFIICLFGFGNHIFGQVVYGLNVVDSFSFTFGVLDSLHHPSLYGMYNSAASLQIIVDTNHTDSTNTNLWEIGNTNKPFFADSTEVTRGIMTDTIHEYPVNASSWFILKYLGVGDEIISFRHKYQTSLQHDGGIVEYSVDSGQNWQNIIGPCLNVLPGIFVENFYNINDTLLTGEPAFSGTSNGWMISKFQFWWGEPYKQNGGPAICSINFNSIIEVRFRFKSDSIPDSLDGWIIGDVNIEQDDYTGGVKNIYKTFAQRVYPNPSPDAIFNFPALDNEQSFGLEIMNVMGARVMRMPYRRQINLSAYPKGLYFYRVTNGTEYYNGKLVAE